jgi:hypothetical protein
VIVLGSKPNITQDTNTTIYFVFNNFVSAQFYTLRKLLFLKYIMNVILDKQIFEQLKFNEKKSQSYGNVQLLFYFLCLGKEFQPIIAL